MIKIKNQMITIIFQNNYKHFSRLNQDLFRKILKISIFKNSEKRKDRTTWLFSPSPSHEIPSKFKKSAALGHFIFTPLQDKGCCGVLQERKRGGSVPSGSKKERRKSPRKRRKTEVEQWQQSPYLHGEQNPQKEPKK